MLTTALTTTAPLFVPVRFAYTWVHQSAHILGNEAHLPKDKVQHAYANLVEEMRQQQAQAGTLSHSVAHFLKVTDSYAPHLFTCYEFSVIPRTNNDLEQTFGRVRHRERRATGRKSASPLMVVRGAVHLVASVVTAVHQFAPSDLQFCSQKTWLEIRQEVESRRLLRSSQRRFRRHHLSFLASLEARLSTAILPT